jgi:hypothetical protein
MLHDIHERIQCSRATIRKPWRTARDPVGGLGEGLARSATCHKVDIARPQTRHCKYLGRGHPPNVAWSNKGPLRTIPRQRGAGVGIEFHTGANLESGSLETKIQPTHATE